MPQYKPCDCCKKLFDEAELEEITIVIKKCDKCSPTMFMPNQGNNDPMVRMSSMQTMPHRNPPPPHLAEVFAPPKE